jgi:hypothetical protein
VITVGTAPSHVQEEVQLARGRIGDDGHIDRQGAGGRRIRDRDPQWPE